MLYNLLVAVSGLVHHFEFNVLFCTNRVIPTTATSGEASSPA